MEAVAVKSNSEAVVVVLPPSLQKFRFVWHTEGGSLFELPLLRGLPSSSAAPSKFANATVEFEDGRESYTQSCCYHKVTENTTLSDYITSLYPDGVIAADCALFAQLYMAASIYDGGADTAADDSSCFANDVNGLQTCCRPPRRRLVAVGEGAGVGGEKDYSFGFFIHYGAAIYEEFPHLRSIGTSESAIRKCLNQHDVMGGSLASAARGQWVAPLHGGGVGGVEQQLWVGFTSDLGIVVETMAVWRVRHQASLVKWAKHILQQQQEDVLCAPHQQYTGDVARMIISKADSGALMLKLLGGRGCHRQVASID